MIVTEVTRIDSRRQKVTLDNEYVFSLYNSEMKKYNIEIDTYIDEQVLSFIENDVLYPRAKERALYIIGSSDKTVKQLTDKLKEGFYPSNIIDKVIDLLASYGYINDERFAISYINIKKRSKSRNQIENELMKKGVNNNDIKSAFEICYMDENDESQELEAIRTFLKKDRYKDLLINRDLKSKAVASLIRRGFQYEHITRCIGEIEEI